jgi:carbamoyltransferase
MTKQKDIWIAAIARGHNAGVCLLKNGEIIFSIEEERLSRQKYDGGPYASMVKILEYTKKLDYLVVAHTQDLRNTAGKVDYSGDDVYTGLARKLGLIERGQRPEWPEHKQVIDLSNKHHALHAACAFYRSGFETATAVVVDGAGTFVPMEGNGEQFTTWEVESIFKCNYPAGIETIYKHMGTYGPTETAFIPNFPSSFYGEFYDNGEPKTHEMYLTEKAGIVKTYEAATKYCGFNSIEAGKTMGLFPYGNPNDKIPPLFDDTGKIPTSNRNIVIPNYPNGAYINGLMFDELESYESSDITKLQNRRDIAYAVQTQTQEQVLNLILKAVEKTGNKNVVLSGGYGLNCVANYYYLDKLTEEGINLYVEPISNDAGTSIGAALLFYHELTKETPQEIKRTDNLYLGPRYFHSRTELDMIVEDYNATLTNADNNTVIDLVQDRNIVAIWQGCSENGPRALGNRSLIYDPTDPNGKDHVNMIKRREYFRPFAGSILEEDVHDWFDLRGMKNSPTMMYAVKCQPGIEEKIPSIIHVDGTCRIQTVTREQNPHYYSLIKCFKQRTGVPIIFNTSFNLGGEPLVETLDDAVRTLANSDIEYLYLPEYSVLITVKN